ncbi:MAG: hypothetical protein KAQ94_09330 [Arcobacteraceae bacterium]|nr:hypothetical protein [Arcobacteraceae bacterium]
MKLKIIMILIFILTYSIFFYSSTQTKNERIEFDLNKQIKDLETHYNLTMNYFLIDVKSIRNNISNKKKAIELFSQAQNATKEQKKILRDKLYKMLKSMYGRMHSRGVLQWQFVFPNNVSFLRMHKPSKYGDDLTDIRYSLKTSNKTKQTVIGFEQGRTTHAFRYTFPFYDKQGNHLGAMEISLSSNALQDKLLNVNKIHSHFLVDKNIFEVKAWETKNLMTKYIPSIEHKDYMFALTEDSHTDKLKNMERNVISKLRNKIDNGILSKKPFAVYSEYKDIMKVITFLPIENTQEKEIVAYVVSYIDSNNIYNICKDYKNSNIIVFFGLLLLFYFIYKNLNNKKELEIEVRKKTFDLKDLNENLEQKIIIEVEKNKHIQEQLFKSEKLASMGDMIGNIAHQWRQPLSVISTGATGMKMQKEFDTLSDKQFMETCDIINNNAQYLSKTIDDFRNFIKGDRTKTIFNLKDTIESFLDLVRGSIKNNHINIILDLQEDIKIDGYGNELIQCLINIFNNAKDVLKEKVEDNRLIFISTSIKEDKAIIKIKDSGGGIPKDIISKVFEPYFTTKHKSQGTGLGLHMTYNLIADGMHGTIEANNVEYEYKDQSYTGAEFTITLPI